MLYVNYISIKLEGNKIKPIGDFNGPPRLRITVPGKEDNVTLAGFESGKLAGRQTHHTHIHTISTTLLQS